MLCVCANKVYVKHNYLISKWLYIVDDVYCCVFIVIFLSKKKLKQQE